MVSRYTLLPLLPLEVHGAQGADSWKKFKRAWLNTYHQAEQETVASTSGDMADHSWRRGT